MRYNFKSLDVTIYFQKEHDLIWWTDNLGNKNQLKMGVNGSKEKLSRTYSERIINTNSQVIERERFGSFGKRASKGILICVFCF